MAESDTLQRSTVLVSYYRMWQRLQIELGLEGRQFPELADNERYAWLTSLDALTPAIEATETTPRTFTELGKLGFDAYHSGWVRDGEKRPTWDGLDPVQQLVWACLARHLVNLLVFDTSEDGGVESHEERMVKFFNVKAAELKEAAK